MIGCIIITIEFDTNKDYTKSGDGNNHKCKEKFKLSIGFMIVYVIGFIIFCECMFDYDLCENNILKDGFECEFKNENDCEYVELLCQVYYTSPPTPINFNTSRENDDLKYIFECNGIECISNANSKNKLFENDYYALYYSTIYATIYPTPRSSATIINFKNTDLESSGTVFYKINNAFECDLILSRLFIDILNWYLIYLVFVGMHWYSHVT